MDFILIHWETLIGIILCVGAIGLGIAVMKNWLQKNVVIAILDGMAAVVKKTPMTWDDDLIAAIRKNTDIQ